MEPVVPIAWRKLLSKYKCMWGFVCMPMYAYKDK